MDFLATGADLANGLTTLLAAVFFTGTGLGLAAVFVCAGKGLLGAVLCVAFITGLAAGFAAVLVATGFDANGLGFWAIGWGSSLFTDLVAGLAVAGLAAANLVKGFDAALTTVLAAALTGSGFFTAALACSRGFLGATFISLSPPGPHCLHTTCNTT
jgi:hypothetical protein